MPIGIIPMLRPACASGRHAPRTHVSMPIGIIPMLRLGDGQSSAPVRQGFNAYRHYPYVETTLVLAIASPTPCFNAYRHYPYVETRYGQGYTTAAN